MIALKEKAQSTASFAAQSVWLRALTQINQIISK